MHSRNFQSLHKAALIIMMLIQILYISQICLASEEDDDVIVKEVSMESVCVDEQRKCLDSPNTKTRIVEKMSVTQDCWKYEYVKNCKKVPSKNDCNKIPLKKFNLSKEECLVKTSMGDRKFCLNTKRSFSHTYKEYETVDEGEIIMDPDNKEAVKSLLCEAFCLDGNCSSVHKSNQESNDEMASSIAQLEMLSSVKNGIVDPNLIKFDIFSAITRRCHYKIAHSDCCNDSGLFKSVGLVKCSAEVKALAREGRKGRCEYLGKFCAKTFAGECIRETKSYCCFPTVLAKTIRLGARDQLGKDLGTAKHPQCGGLEITDVEKLDFSRLDFNEFFNLEVEPMMKDYTQKDNEALIKRSFPTGSSDGHKVGIDEEGMNRKLFESAEGEGTR